MMRSLRIRASGQRGIALLVVLWGCTLAAITLGALASNARVEGVEARGQYRKVQASYAAEAGIEQAVYRLRAMDEAERWATDGRSYTWREGDIHVGVSMVDEDGKVDLNRATPERIEALLLALGIEPDRARAATAAIVGWGARRPIESDALLARGGFASLEELHGVQGLDVDIITRIEPSLTLWGLEEPNLAHASPAVVSAVTGADAATSAAYVARVRDLAGGFTTLPPVPGNRPGTAVRRSSGTVNIVSRAAIEGGLTLTIDATVILKNEPGDPRAYRVVRWRELVSESGS